MPIERNGAKIDIKMVNPPEESDILSTAILACNDNVGVVAVRGVALAEAIAEHNKNWQRIVVAAERLIELVDQAREETVLEYRQRQKSPSKE